MGRPARAAPQEPPMSRATTSSAAKVPVEPGRPAPRRRPAGRRAAQLLGALALALAGAACAPGAPDALRVRDAWIRPAPAGRTTAAYLMVEGGPSADRLLGGALAEAAAAELHETVREGSMVRMVARPEGLVVPAGGTLALAPGGAHLMLVDLARDLVAGETVTLSLRFEGAGEIAVAAAVRQDG